MYNFKRLLALMLVLCMGLCLCACGGGDASSENSTTKGTEGTTAPTQSTQQTEPTQSTSDGKVEYKVTVLYPDGTPVVGCYVMLCTEEMCLNPVATDENGVAIFRQNEDDYKVKLAAKVEGYVEIDYIPFESGSTELTITLTPEE